MNEFTFDCKSAYPHFSEGTVTAANPHEAAELFADQQWRIAAIRRAEPADLKITVFETKVQSMIRASAEAGEEFVICTELKDFLADVETKNWEYVAGYLSRTVQLRSEVGAELLREASWD